MARKKPTFKCFKCKVKLGSAAASFDHFQVHPKHRNAKQLKDYKANKVLKRKQRTGGLPTVQRRVGVVRAEKYCTECGNRKMPSHNYCGGCGSKA